ncbi:MAG: ATP-binding cassette domain-containing protein [Armatimonadetes bacterium]|nr:ATP-binding cassette domain-containing protein [Armatimonadota bacterium]
MSSSDLAVSIQGLSKSYTIAHDDAGHSAAQALRRRLRDPLRRAERETFWALRDVSFDIYKGDVVGIIGRNGAGKSTLLKILSRITEPTAGRIELYGRVGSLLEVGTGFHPELTGRENIFLNGAILGMSRREIARQFDAIVDFAGVAQFLDTPVKRYSSGMYVRLAFAVAAHLNPEILIVDEVLAVGDSQFQKKCLGKMQEVAEQEGRTVLFVSHNMAAVTELCSRAILLGNGRIQNDGSTLTVVNEYLDGATRRAAEIVFADAETAPGNENVRLAAVRVLDDEGRLADKVDISRPLSVEVEYVNMIPGTILNISTSVYGPNDVYVLASPSISDRAWYQRPHPVGRFRSRCRIPANFLNDGPYRFSVVLVENGIAVATADHVVSVEAVDYGSGRGTYFDVWGGVVRPSLDWETEMLGGAPEDRPTHAYAGRR